MFTENKLNTAKSNKRTKETKIDNNDEFTDKLMVLLIIRV